MPPTVQVGTILIEDQSQMTQVLGLESEPCSGKWSLLKVLDGFALDRNGPRTNEFQEFTWDVGAVVLLTSYLSDAARRRSRCGSVRGRPVLSSHFSPGLAPQVGHRTVSACSRLAVMTA